MSEQCEVLGRVEHDVSKRVAVSKPVKRHLQAVRLNTNKSIAEQTRNQPNRLDKQAIDKFKQACIKANVQPTERQLSKYRNGYGAAYNVLKG